jgi:hypothetical protein
VIIAWSGLRYGGQTRPSQAAFLTLVIENDDTMHNDNDDECDLMSTV